MDRLSFVIDEIDQKSLMEHIYRLFYIFRVYQRSMIVWN